jgi:5'-nucleotidase (lipoprotein e(P4) family)
MSAEGGGNAVTSHGMHAAPARPTMTRLACLAATLALFAACTTADDDGDRETADIIVGDEDKADGVPGVELVGWLPAGTVDGALSAATPRAGYLFYAAAGSSVGVEVTRSGTAAGIDTVLKIYGPRQADGSYPTTGVTDDDAGYGKLSKVTGRTLPSTGAGGFYLAEVALKTAPTASTRFRLALTCATGRCDRPGPAAPLGLDLRWTEKSAEMRAISLSQYALATERVEAMRAAGLPSDWAVVLDIDETTLSNLTYQRERAELGTAYSGASWLAWVQRKTATPMPGAAAFIARVRALGGKVVLVSNRKDGSECGPTAENLAALGIAYDGMLCRTTTSDKNPRFEAIEDGTAPGLPALTTVMYVGDNIQDFPNLSQDVRSESDQAFAEFGHRFILIPNPMYGSWEKNL